MENCRNEMMGGFDNPRIVVKRLSDLADPVQSELDAFVVAVIDAIMHGRF